MNLSRLIVGATHMDLSTRHVNNGRVTAASKVPEIIPSDCFVNKCRKAAVTTIDVGIRDCDAWCCSDKVQPSAAELVRSLSRTRMRAVARARTLAEGASECFPPQMFRCISGGCFVAMLLRLQFRHEAGEVCRETATRSWGYGQSSN